MPDLKNVERAGSKSLSRESADKGEAFVLAMIQEGHSYKSMKVAFGKCVLRTWLRLNGGVISEAAKEMGIARRQIFVRIKEFGMRDELAAIRAAGEQK